MAGDCRIDRNANDSIRLRRNQQRMAVGALTGTVIVNSPLFNTGAAITLTLLATGGLQTVTNALSLKLDGTTLALGAAGLKINGVHNHVSNAVPTGVINGTNPTFTLASTPLANTLMLFKNGMLQRAGAGNDYTLATATITFLAGNIPQAGSVLLAAYISS